MKGVEKQEPVLTENERRNQTTGEERRVGNVVEEVGHVIYYGTSHFSDYWCRTNDDTAAPCGTHSPKATRALCCQGYEISEDPIFGRSIRTRASPRLIKNRSLSLEVAAALVG